MRNDPFTPAKEKKLYEADKFKLAILAGGTLFCIFAALKKQNPPVENVISTSLGFGQTPTAFSYAALTVTIIATLFIFWAFIVKLPSLTTPEDKNTWAIIALAMANGVSLFGSVILFQYKDLTFAIPGLLLLFTTYKLFPTYPYTRETQTK